MKNKLKTSTLILVLVGSLFAMIAMVSPVSGGTYYVTITVEQIGIGDSRDTDWWAEPYYYVDGSRHPSSGELGSKMECAVMDGKSSHGCAYATTKSKTIYYSPGDSFLLKMYDEDTFSTNDLMVQVSISVSQYTIGSWEGWIDSDAVGEDEVIGGVDINIDQTYGHNVGDGTYDFNTFYVSLNFVYSPYI